MTQRCPLLTSTCFSIRPRAECSRTWSISSGRWMLWTRLTRYIRNSPESERNWARFLWSRPPARLSASRPSTMCFLMTRMSGTRCSPPRSKTCATACTERLRFPLIPKSRKKPSKATRGEKSLSHAGRLKCWSLNWKRPRKMSRGLPRTWMMKSFTRSIRSPANDF